MEGEPEMLPSAEAQLDAKEQEKKAALVEGKPPSVCCVHALLPHCALLPLDRYTMLSACWLLIVMPHSSQLLVLASCFRCQSVGAVSIIP